MGRQKGIGSNEKTPNWAFFSLLGKKEPPIWPGRGIGSPPPTYDGAGGMQDGADICRFVPGVFWRRAWPGLAVWKRGEAAPETPAAVGCGMPGLGRAGPICRRADRPRHERRPHGL